jgi:hypothetical protein
MPQIRNPRDKFLFIITTFVFGNTFITGTALISAVLLADG